MATTYTKLRDGSWGIRSTDTLSAGQTVTVRKASGESRTETVGRIVWTGDGVTLASIQKQRSATRVRSSTRRDCDDFCQGCRLCM